MPFLHKPITFLEPDPLGDGLGAAIEAEQAEPERFDLFEQLDGRLAHKWEAILVEARKDPDFLSVYDEV